jgi:hypothetical protein
LKADLEKYTADCDRDEDILNTRCENGKKPLYYIAKGYDTN